MEDSREILLSSLESFGVSIPENISSLKHLTPSAFVSLCRQSLDLLDQSGASSSSSSSHTLLSDSVLMADKLKICTDLGMAFKNLGYFGDISYHKFLYPSEEDLFKFVRFLVERLSESPAGLNLKDVGARQKTEESKSERTTEDQTQEIDNEGVDLNLQKVEAILKDLRPKTELPDSFNFEAEDALLGGSHKLHLIPQNLDEAAVDDACSSAAENLIKNELFRVESREDSTAEPGESEKGASSEASDHQDNEHDPLIEEKTSYLKEQASEVPNEAKEIRNQEKQLQEVFGSMTLELQHLEKEFELLKVATDMAFDESHPIDFYINQLNEKADARKRNIVELKLQWDAFRDPLEVQKRSLMDSLYANKPEAQEKLHKLRKVELEMQSVFSEIRKREEEHLKVSAELEQQPKTQSRRSYIERIKEITKNSGKLDADIEQILRETREVQLESNTIQERLSRTYAVADEIIFREAKKDPVGRQAYRLLTSIHETFEQISEKVLAADRVRREVAEYEKKLAAMASRSANVEKVRSDLDAIKKENEFLETTSR